MVISGVSPERVAIPELGVAPPDDSEMELEDELCDELLNISPLSTIVSPLTEPVLRHFRCLHHCIRSHLFLLNWTLPPVSSRGMFHSGKRNEHPTIDLFPSFLIYPAQSYYDPATSLIMSDLQDDSGYLPPDSPATMDQYIAADGDQLLGDPSDLPLLSVPLLPVPVADVSGPVSVGTHFVGELVLVPSVVLPDLSQEGPFDVDQTVSASGDTPRVYNSLPGCQYRMTSYDAAN